MAGDLFQFPSEFAAKLESALALELPYSERLLRPAKSHAAVLALFAQKRDPEPGNPNGISLLVTKRTDSLQSHQGQMAFPGGRCEPDELSARDFLKTALRETEEEVGISRDLIQTIGALPQMTTITQYQVVPMVGFLKTPLEELQMRPDPVEVAETVWIPWSVLTAPETYAKEMIRRGDVQFPTHVYTVQGHRIWGATGAMIKNLLDRLNRIG